MKHFICLCLPWIFSCGNQCEDGFVTEKYGMCVHGIDSSYSKQIDDIFAITLNKYTELLSGGSKIINNFEDCTTDVSFLSNGDEITKQHNTDAYAVAWYEDKKFTDFTVIIGFKDLYECLYPSPLAHEFLHIIYALHIGVKRYVNEPENHHPTGVFGASGAQKQIYEILKVRCSNEK